MFVCLFVSSIYMFVCKMHHVFVHFETTHDRFVHSIAFMQIGSRYEKTKREV